jgi:hypothetical protein
MYFAPNSPLSNLWSIKVYFLMIRILFLYATVGMPRAGIFAWRTILHAGNVTVPINPLLSRWETMFGSAIFPISKADRQFTAKLSPRYKGPYILAEFTIPVSVRLIDAAAGTTTRAHVSQLKSA